MSLRSLAALVLAAFAAGTCAAAGYPERPVTLVVPYPPGGATDIVGRIIAKAMEQRLGKPVVVDNRAGAGTIIGAGMVAQAPADGYMLLISSNTTFTINPALRTKLPYDPVKSFESIGTIGSSPLVLLANNGVQAKTVAELVALAKGRPGKLSYGSFGAGTSSHFAGEMFKQAAGIDLLHVPYKGSSPAMTDLIAGQVQFTFDTNVAALPMVQTGRVKAIAVTSAKRSASLPGVPTIAESGYPGFEMVPWIAVVAPRGLPADVRGTLVKAFAQAVADPATRSSLEKSGVDVAYEPPLAYGERVARELPLLRAYVYKANIHAD